MGSISLLRSSRSLVKRQGSHKANECGSFESPIAVSATCVALHAFFHPIYGNLLRVAISYENPLNGPAKMRRRAFQKDSPYPDQSLITFDRNAHPALVKAISP
jgi:hypothetical protein